ncbi:aromatic amino acid efflux DMT transporter YddG [Salmonella enterica subsp. enterica serovar Javiana]|nr:aromatic amino acid efflux DMT transporter YddG [Salmonella enterica subsp. enterica serovar Javiana]
MTSQKATLIGLVAIVLWSTMVGLIRGVSEGLGPVGGAAMIYSLSGLLLIFTVGLPDIRRFPGRYLIAGSVLFVSYEICLALSLGYAATRHQAIEVGMVNYLWPSLTILFAILFNGQKTNWLIVPGLLIALTGVCWVLGGENGLNAGEIINNVATSPLSYFLAFLGAFIWATYCTVTNKYARGFNGITVFVLLTAVALWFHYFLTPQPAMIFSLPVIAKLFTAALTLGFAYAAWNVGILHGNVTIMAVGSYFTPVMSSALAALLLSSHIYLATTYSETLNMTTFGEDAAGDAFIANKTQNFEAVAQYQFDFGLRPSIAYLKSKGKNLGTYGDQDLVEYIDVGATYYFNKNMSTFVDYKINLLDDSDFTKAAKVSTDNIVAVGLNYQF